MKKDILCFQLRAIIIYEYLRCFNKLENEIREIFERNIQTLKPNFVSKLYFVYGGKIGTYIDYEQDTVKLRENSFKEQETFKELSIIQILKLNKEANCIEEFKVQVNSLQQKTVYFEFYDACIKLVNMRNILAHELSNINFKTKDIIETLSDEKIIENVDERVNNYDISIMDENTKCIFSNLVYLKLILKMLNQEVRFDEEEREDIEQGKIK